MGEEISQNMIQLEKVEALAEQIAQHSDEQLAGHIRESISCLHRLRDDVTSRHRQLSDQLQSAANAQVCFCVVCIVIRMIIPCCHLPVFHCDCYYCRKL